MAPTPACFMTPATVLVAELLLGLVEAHFVYDPRYACGVCRDLRTGLWKCDRYDACDSLDPLEYEENDCASVCPQPDPSDDVHDTPGAVAEATDGLELRVAKGFGTKDYGLVRISVISAAGQPAAEGFFDYSSRFVHRWTHLHLHTAMKEVVPGETTKFSLGGREVEIRVPKAGVGVAGVLLSDPCVLWPTGHMWVECANAQLFDTNKRTPKLIDAFVGDNSTDFWGMLGNAFYDRSGEISAGVWSSISTKAKSKLFMSVPGSHDLWALGQPEVSVEEDQCGNGFMQFNGQDVKSAEDSVPGTSLAPYNFTIDPSTAVIEGGEWGAAQSRCLLPPAMNFFWYNQIGNIGFVGHSWSHDLDETLPLMYEACAWLAEQPEIEVAILLGHWDDVRDGSPDDTQAPWWYGRMSGLPGCAKFAARQSLKFIAGHTSCEGARTETGVVLGGQGMEGCSRLGVPVLDTSGDRLRVLYFDATPGSGLTDIVDCVKEKGWRQCEEYAEVWFDEPLSHGSGEVMV